MICPIDNLYFFYKLSTFLMIHLYQYMFLIISICPRFRPKSLAALDPVVPKPATKELPGSLCIWRFPEVMGVPIPDWFI